MPQLPIVTLHNRPWYVDALLRELRSADESHDLTWDTIPLDDAFDGLTLAESVTLAKAVCQHAESRGIMPKVEYLILAQQEGA